MLEKGAPDDYPVNNFVNEMISLIKACMDTNLRGTIWTHYHFDAEQIQSKLREMAGKTW